MKIRKFKEFTHELNGGKGDKTSLNKLDAKELKVGKYVEMEHTSDKIVATEIAVDHLTEDPHYYSKLIKAGLTDEKEAKALARKYGWIE